MVGNLRAELGRVVGASGSGIVCALLLASGLLAGCNDTSGTSASHATPSATSATTSVVADSISGNTSSSSSASTGSTSGSSPVVSAKSIDVTWSAPTANTNGSALTDLAGYTIHYGTSPSALSQSVKVANAGATDHIVQGLSGGTWYFAVTAYTSAGLQSSYSAIVSRTIT
jgi:hypothetical protein